MQSHALFCERHFSPTLLAEVEKSSHLRQRVNAREGPKIVTITPHLPNEAATTSHLPNEENSSFAVCLRLVARRTQIVSIRLEGKRIRVDGVMCT